jgi:serine/threonine protein kinase
MGIAYRVAGRYGGYFAAKIPHQDPTCIDKLNMEIRVLKDLWGKGGHQHIVKYIDDCIYSGLPVLIEEYIEGEKLTSAINQWNIDYDDAIEMVGKLADVVLMLHKHGYIHRDFAPDNIILRRNNIKDAVLIDFGTAKYMWQGIQMAGTRICGKPYIAPETCIYGQSSEFSDIYSLGAILLALLAHNSNIEKYFRSSAKGPVLKDNNISNLLGRRVPTNIENIIKRCLSPVPNDRMTINEFISALSGSAISGARIEVLGQIYYLSTNSKIKIGRDESCDVRLSSEYVSRQHAEIYYSDGRWLVRDLGSTNGTIIYRGAKQHIVYGGHRGQGTVQSGKEEELRDGDVIGIAFDRKDPFNSIVYITFRVG